MDCLFCKIASGEIPSKKIYEDEHSFAFLDINPAAEGHALVIPKRHCRDIFDAPEAELQSLIIAVKEVAGMMKKLGYEDVNILQNTGKHAGQIVHHLHFHVIPRREEDGIFIKFPRIHTDDASLDAAAKKLLSSKQEPEEMPKEKPRKKEKDDWEDLDW